MTAPTLEAPVTTPPGEPDWRLAACRGADPDLFHSPGDGDDEPYYPSPEALVYCQRCELRVACLAHAQALDLQYGVWGGQTAYQRRQLARVRSRLTCPGCGSHDVVVEGRFEICLPCGVSWPALPVSP